MHHEQRLEGYMTMSQAARVLGCSPDLVRYMVRRGRLASLVTPLGRLVRADDVEALARGKADADIREQETVPQQP